MRSVQTDQSLESPFRFSIYQLLCLVTVLAASLSIFRFAPILAITLGCLGLHWVFGLGNSKGGKKFAVLCFIAIPLETACGFLSFHTIGEMMSALLRLVVILNVFFLFLFALNARRLAATAVLLLALLIIPYHFCLGVGWWMIHNESCRIVEYANKTHQETGAYPADLENYSYQNGSVESFIRYRRTQEGYTVFYSVGTPNTSHWSTNGGPWCYYPD